jgi:hypothetical protein
MMPKSGYRFSENIMLQRNLERDDDSKKSHHALGCPPLFGQAADNGYFVSFGEGLKIVHAGRTADELPRLLPRCFSYAAVVPSASTRQMMRCRTRIIAPRRLIVPARSAAWHSNGGAAVLSRAGLSGGSPACIRASCRTNETKPPRGPHSAGGLFVPSIRLNRSADSCNRRFDFSTIWRVFNTDARSKSTSSLSARISWTNIDLCGMAALLCCHTGGSATGLSATDAWGRAAAGDRR